MAQRETADENEKRTDELTIRIKGAALPDDPDDQTAVVDDLGELLADALRENHGIESERVTGGVGPEYTQIGSGCPECGTELDLRDYTYTGNGAIASAGCSECHFRGAAIYRLIDIETTSENWRSAVEAGKATPRRYGYLGQSVRTRPTALPMTRTLDGTDAVDRFHIDADLLTGAAVWLVIDESGETLLYQEAPEESADPGGAVVQHLSDGDDRLLEIGVRETRTGYDEFTGQVESWVGYPLRDPVVGEEVEFHEELPDADSSRFTAVSLVN